MNLKTNMPERIHHVHIKDALVIGFVLSVFSYGLGVLLFWLRIPAAVTVVDDLAIGALGAGLALFYMSSVTENHIYLHAKEKMILVAELNYHVYSALATIRHATSLEDPATRAKEVDEAIQQIDRVLLDLVPTAASADAPRSSLPEQK